MLPNFLVIGAAKAGSTSLYEYMKGHPDVFMPPTKELDFFVSEKNWKLGLEWYEHQFDTATHSVRAIGEASVRYTMHPWYEGIPERIATVLPNARLIYIVRHPITRMISHYQHRVRANHEHRALEEALFGEPLYLNTSRYAYQLERYLEFFPVEQILVVVTEELRQNRAATLNRVLGFLDLDPGTGEESITTEYNVTSTKRAPRTATEILMRLPGWNRFASSIPEAVKQVGRRLSHHQMRPVTLSKTATEELEERLRQDVARLRNFVRGDFDGWGIA
jgi:hypothetical protein